MDKKRSHRNINSLYVILSFIYVLFLFLMAYGSIWFQLSGPKKIMLGDFWLFFITTFIMLIFSILLIKERTSKYFYFIKSVSFLVIIHFIFTFIMLFGGFPYYYTPSFLVGIIFLLLSIKYLKFNHNFFFGILYAIPFFIITGFKLYLFYIENVLFGFGKLLLVFVLIILAFYYLKKNKWDKL